MSNYEKHLDRFRKYSPEISSKLEKIFDISMQGVQFKPMTKFVGDLAKEMAEGNPFIREKILRTILGFTNYSSKVHAEAFVNPSLPNNVYVNTYLHHLIKSDKTIKYIVAHELGHVASFLFCPKFLNQKNTNIKEQIIKKDIFEDIAEYLIPSLLKKTEYPSIRRINNVVNSLKPSYKFVKRTCDKKGKHFIKKILNNPPEDIKEIENPELYFNRIGKDFE